MGCFWMVQTPVPTLAMATLGGMEITKALTRLKGLENDPVFMLLHGWGSNEYDLPDLLNYCGAGSADYASLQAPIAYGMGYTWFGSWAHEGVPEGKWTSWDDTDDMRLAYFAQMNDVDLTTSTCRKGAYHSAIRREVHPVREYFGNLA